MNTQSTLLSWGGILVLGGGCYVYYSRNRRGRRGDYRRAGPAEADGALRRQIDASTKRGRDKTVRARDRDQASTITPSSSRDGNGDPSSIRNKALRKRIGNDTPSSTSEKRDPGVDEPNATHRSSGKDEAEEAISNVELAQRMTSAKAGTAFKAPDAAGKRARTVKQSRLNGKLSASDDNEVGVSTASSAGTGPEPEDEVSSANSPALGATTPPTDSTGVSDMLESPTPKHAVLRLTDPVQPEPKRQSRPSKAPSAQAPTKKQRQRQAKNEARKAEREEQEKERRQLMEKQLRTAREAEGRPAHNGNGWTYGSGPTPSAWDPSFKQPEATSVAPTNVSLLDTFEDASGEALTEPRQVSVGVNGRDHASYQDGGAARELEATKTTKAVGFPTKPTRAWDQDLPSEEDQMKMIEEQQQSEQWTTVATKKTAKKPKAQPSNEDNTG